MSRVIPKAKVKSKVKLASRTAKADAWSANDPATELNHKQRLLLTGATMAALVGLIAEYPRRHTIDFEGIVRARFMDGVREIQHKEREAGLKGGLADLAETDCRMTLEVEG